MISKHLEISGCQLIAVYRHNRTRPLLLLFQIIINNPENDRLTKQNKKHITTVTQCKCKCECEGYYLLAEPTIESCNWIDFISVAYVSWYHWNCGRTQRQAATINQLACPSYSLYVQLLWYPMYYPRGMKARVSPVQWSKPHSILAPTQDSNPGGRIQNHKRWPLHYHCTVARQIEMPIQFGSILSCYTSQYIGTHTNYTSLNRKPSTDGTKNKNNSACFKNFTGPC